MPPTFYLLLTIVTDWNMNNMDNILTILDDQTPTHVVDAVLCELFK